jgi:hypothetical protein
MTQVKRDHDRIVRIADSLDLTLVAGSDNHGWGRTAPGWTLRRIPGMWRAYSPDSLALVRHPADRLVSVTSCHADVDTIDSSVWGHYPAHLGIAIFTPGGRVPGYNPCAAINGRLVVELREANDRECCNRPSTYGAAGQKT